MSVDPELCIGSGECARLLPEAFELERSRGIAIAQPPAAFADATLLRRARLNCPTQAIELHDENGDPVPDGGADG